MVLKRTTAGLILRANTFFSMQRNENDGSSFLGRQKCLRPDSFRLFSEKEKNRRVVRRRLLLM